MKKLYLLFLACCMAMAGWAQTASVQVIHNSPTPGTNTGPTVDIYVNDALLPELTAVPFRAATAFLEVSAGVDIEVAVAVSPSNSSADAIATFPLGQLADGGVYSVIANGIVGDAETPFGLVVNDQARTSASMMGQVDVSVFHGSPDAPDVDVDARTVGNLIAGLPFGSFSADYLSVLPQLYYLDIRAAGNPDIVATFEADLSSLAGGAATVFASGLLGDTPAFGLFAALPDGTVIELPGAQVARLQVIHNSPSPTVDVYANGGLLIDDFEFRTATPFDFVPAGVTVNIGVALDNSTSVNDTLVNFPVVFENGKTYVVAADGVVGDMGRPFTLHVNDMGLERAADEGAASFAVLHGSPDAPNVDVDIRTLGNVVSDLPYGAFSDYLSADTAVYYIDVRAAGDPDIVATFEADLRGLADSALTVFASGFLSDTPAFGLFAALPGGQVVELPATQVARLQVIHNSPSPTVDVYANGALFIDDFDFQSATAFDFVPAGLTVNIGVALGTSTSVNDTLVNFPVVFENGEAYIAIANGIVGDAENPFTLAVNDMARERSTDPSVAQLLVFHGSPGAPAVDVSDFGLAPFIEGLAYGTFTDDYLDLPLDNYFLELRPAGTGPNDVVSTFGADLSAFNDGVGIVLASGILNDDPPLDLILVQPNGVVTTLPALALVNIIHNSPAAAAATVDLWAFNAIKIVEDLDYRTATGISFFPTRTPITIGIAPGDSDAASDILFNLEDPVTFEDGAYHIVIANGIPGDAETPFELAIDTGSDLFAPNAQSVNVTAFHGSQNAPAVDIIARDLQLPLIDNIAYGEFQPTAALPPGNYYLEVYPDDSESLVATFESEITPAYAGLSLVAVVSGLVGEEPPLDLLFFPPIGDPVMATPVAQVQVIHNSPSPTVDIYANGGLLIPDLEFRNAVPFVDLPTRTAFDIAVAPGNSNSVADSLVSFKNVAFEDGRKYIVMATGVVGNMDTPFGLEVFDMARTRADGGTGVDLLLYHGAPDAPEVDVVADGVGVLFDDVEYSEYQGYLNVPAAAYVLNVTPSNDNNTIVRSYNADITTLEGGAATVFATGFLGDEDGEEAFGVWVALPDGMTFPLSEIVSTREVEAAIPDVQIAPNPVRTTATVQFTLAEPLNLTIQLTDLYGQVVREEYLGQQAAGEQSRTLDTYGLPQGVYFYNLVTPLGVLSKRFVKAQ